MGQDQGLRQYPLRSAASFGSLQNQHACAHYIISLDQCGADFLTEQMRTQWMNTGAAGTRSGDVTLI